MNKLRHERNKKCETPDDLTYMEDDSLDENSWLQLLLNETR